MSDPTSIREYLLAVAPPWLLRLWGRRYLTVIGWLADAYADAALDAVKARFLRYTPGDALAEAGEHYELERLLDETDDAYRARLHRAFPSYRQGGSSIGVQRRLREAGHATASVIEAHDWSVDDGSWWARFWVVLEQPHGLTAPEAWDDPSTWDDGSIWTDLLPQAVVEQIRRLVRKWKGAHARAESLVVVLSGELWDVPAGTWDDAGTWGGEAAYVSL